MCAYKFKQNPSYYFDRIRSFSGDVCSFQAFRQTRGVTPSLAFKRLIKLVTFERPTAKVMSPPVMSEYFSSSFAWEILAVIMYSWTVTPIYFLNSLEMW